VIADLLVLLVIVVVAGGIGLWFGIVVLAPRLQRRIDRAATTQATDAAKEPDGPAN
jgi:hypothetical protein